MPPSSPPRSSTGGFSPRLRPLASSARGRRFAAVVIALGLGLAGSDLQAQTPTEPPAVTQARARARELIGAGKQDDALKVLEAAAVQAPDSAALSADIGNVQLALGDLGSAIGAYQKSLAIQPEQPVVRYNLAYALRQTGRLDEAVTAYQAYLASQPTDADAWYGLAQAQEARSAPGAAADAYEKYAENEKRPEQKKWVTAALAKAKELRATAAASTVSPAPAPATAVAATAPAPTPAASAPTSPVSPASAAAETPTAAPRRDVRRGPGFDQALEDLRAGRYDEALKALDGLSAELKEADYAVLAARAGGHLGRYEGATAAALYRRAMTSAPDRAEPGLLFGLAEALRVGGDVDESRRMLERALAHPDIGPGLAAAAKARLAAR